MTGESVRVLVVDDDPVVLDSFCERLSAETDIVVVGRAGSGRDALQLATGTTPDVVLLDMKMEGMDGIATTRELVADAPDEPDQQVRVLAMTAFHDDTAIEVLKAGASGVLLKQSYRELGEAVRRVGQGDGWIDQAVANDVLRQLSTITLRGRRGRRELVERLSPRETEVLCLMADGLYNEEIAKRLGVKLTTVRTHVTRAQTKIGARNRVEAVRVAYRSGLIDA